MNLNIFNKIKQKNNMLLNATPLFLFGPPRSGTTILTRILNSHPNILLTNETAIFLQLDENIKKSKAGVKSGILYGKQYHKLWADHLLENAQFLIESYYSKIAKTEEKTELRYWGEKHPHFFRSLNFLNDLYPNAVYIYAIRDPRDTACSIAEMNQVEIRKPINTWTIFSKHYEQFVASLKAERVISVKYEVFINNYIDETHKILKNLGLDLHDQLLKFIDKYKNIDSHSLEISEMGPIDYTAKSIGRWKKDMSNQEKDLAEKMFNDFLIKYDYKS